MPDNSSNNQRLYLDANATTAPLPEVADIHILDDVGHMGMFEAKKEIQNIIKNFVKYCHDFHKMKTRKTTSS